MRNFAYGDSCQTGDDKYVIAQFRSDADLNWVAELRAFLVKDELKYKWFQPERHRVRSNPRLWARVENGVHQAEITILDPLVYRDLALEFYLEQQAIPNVDFDLRTINELSGEYIIHDSPLGFVGSFGRNFLNSLLMDSTRVESTSSFAPAVLKTRAGGRLKDAVVIAARSHAMISPSEMNDLIDDCADGAGHSFLSRLERIQQMARVFDVEHPRSLPILNEFSERLANAAGVPDCMTHAMFRGGLVSEHGSLDHDHIQAADIAAGWAVDLLTLTNGDYRSLARRFAWVGVNGVVIPA